MELVDLTSSISQAGVLIMWKSGLTWGILYDFDGSFLESPYFISLKCLVHESTQIISQFHCFHLWDGKYCCHVFSRYTHGVDSTENEEVVGGRKFKFAFATNGFRSPAYPSANAPPYRQNAWGNRHTSVHYSHAILILHCYNRHHLGSIQAWKGSLRGVPNGDTLLSLHIWPLSLFLHRVMLRNSGQSRQIVWFKSEPNSEFIETYYAWIQHICHHWWLYFSSIDHPSPCRQGCIIKISLPTQPRLWTRI